VGRRRVDLKEAAEVLGSTTEALRKRAKRGTLDSETGEDGKLYVWVDDRVAGRDGRVDSRVDGRVDDPDDDRREELIDRMASEIDWLRREVERKDTLLMSLMQRIPELEAPPEASPEPREARVTPSEDWGDSEGRADAEKPVERRSWLYRFFFGS
jgi:hypothetical protein